jgi:hypothetical protein
MHSALSITCVAAVVIALAACGNEHSEPAKDSPAGTQSSRPVQNDNSSTAETASTAAAAAATAPECREEPMKSREACNPATTTNPPPAQP